MPRVAAASLTRSQVVSDAEHETTVEERLKIVMRMQTTMKKRMKKTVAQRRRLLLRQNRESHEPLARRRREEPTEKWQRSHLTFADSSEEESSWSHEASPPTSSPKTTKLGKEGKGKRQSNIQQKPIHPFFLSFFASTTLFHPPHCRKGGICETMVRWNVRI